MNTLVISGCEDDEFRESSRHPVERCVRDEVTLVVSGITTKELARAPQPVRDVLSSIHPEELERIETDDEVESLAQR
ncbi:MAG: hypothetical protein OXN89_01795 [Bryobacterales bacterium]|nr:hypothetical protein [Bryobacterales bacterium]